MSALAITMTCMITGSVDSLKRVSVISKARLRTNLVDRLGAGSKAIMLSYAALVKYRTNVVLCRLAVEKCILSFE